MRRGILATPTPSCGTAPGPELGLSHRAQDRGAVPPGPAAMAQHFLCSEQDSVCSGSRTSKQRTDRKEAAAPALCLCVGARVGVCACGHGCACATGQQDRDVPGSGAADFRGTELLPSQAVESWLSQSLGSPAAVEAVGLSPGRAYRQARRHRKEEARDTCWDQRPACSGDTSVAALPQVCTRKTCLLPMRTLGAEATGQRAKREDSPCGKGELSSWGIWVRGVGRGAV